MKNTCIFFVFLSLLSLSCEVTTSNGPVSASGNGGINGVSFGVDTTYMVSSPGMLVAKGIARNDGPGNIASPWYVRCLFFTDSSQVVVLGTDYTQIGVPLAPGQAVYWMITLSSSNVDVRSFPDFTVGGFNATYIPMSGQGYANTSP